MGISYSTYLANADRTREAGATLGRLLFAAQLSQPLTIYLEGELGAGKTTFVSGMLHAMGHAGPVRSPTYTLVEPYEFKRADGTTLNAIHMDIYRLTDPSQLEELGVRDMLVAGTVLLIEWPSQASGFLPQADMHIQLDYDAANTGRNLQINVHSSPAVQLLQTLQWQYSTSP